MLTPYIEFFLALFNSCDQSYHFGVVYHGCKMKMNPMQFIKWLEFLGKIFFACICLNWFNGLPCKIFQKTPKNLEIFKCNTFRLLKICPSLHALIIYNCNEIEKTFKWSTIYIESTHWFYLFYSCFPWAHGSYVAYLINKWHTLASSVVCKDTLFQNLGMIVNEAHIVWCALSDNATI